VQSVHAVLLEKLVNLPAGHNSQMPVLGVAAYEPGRHARHTSGLLLPGMGLAFPTSQAIHELASKAPRAVLYVPARHLCSRGAIHAHVRIRRHRDNAEVEGSRRRHTYG
jgi:hypothetical protein